MKQRDPFAGLKLSEQTGLDQRLFSGQPTKSRSADAPKNTTQKTRNPAIRETGRTDVQDAGRTLGRTKTQDPRNEAGREDARPDANEIGIPGSRQVSPVSPGVDGGIPILKLTYLVTESEWNSFEDLKLDLRRRHRVKATKNDITRIALRFITNDYIRKQEDSILVKELRRK